MFLYSKPNALPVDLCNVLIQSFEQSPLKKRGAIGYLGETVEKHDVKSSTDITFDPSFIQDPVWGPQLQAVVDTLSHGMEEYIARFDKAMNNMDDFRLNDHFNMQRYTPGEGFHGWHCERAGLTHSNRILAWMFYLNDVTDNGGTQFHYQQHIEQPQAGKLIIWPSDWMYLHRGLVSPTQTKYVLTGWYVHYK